MKDILIVYSQSTLISQSFDIDFWKYIFNKHYFLKTIQEKTIYEFIPKFFRTDLITENDYLNYAKNMQLGIIYKYNFFQDYEDNEAYFIQENNGNEYSTFCLYPYIVFQEIKEKYDQKYINCKEQIPSIVKELEVEGLPLILNTNIYVLSLNISDKFMKNFYFFNRNDSINNLVEIIKFLNKKKEKISINEINYNQQYQFIYDFLLKDKTINVFFDWKYGSTNGISIDIGNSFQIKAKLYECLVCN